MELITKSFESQCLAFPSRVDQLLATITTIEGATDLLAKAEAMSKYASQLKAGIDVERPISLGVLKIKAKLGELMPAGKVGAGRGNKIDGQPVDFNKSTISAYRKLAANADRLEEYYEAIEDVPTQNDFIRFCGSDSVICNKHNNDIVDWYTPQKFIDLARLVLDSIDLDPASSDHAQKIVEAKEFYTAKRSGLSVEWRGNVWLNPPFKMPLIQQFVFKLLESIEAKTVQNAILLTNGNSDTKWFQGAAQMAKGVCFTSGRVKFYNRAGEFSSPTNGQTFFYFGSRFALFRKHFDKVGVILCKA